MVMYKYYFTFGGWHLFAKYYLIIEAKSEDSARDYMFDKLGTNWAFSYTEEDWRKEYIKSGIIDRNHMQCLGVFQADED